MTEVMTMATGGGVNLSTYTYTSEPRIVQNPRKSARGVIPARLLASGGNGNPMYDRRVVRGSNYAKRIDGDNLPKWNPYFSNARSLTQQGEMGPAETTTAQQQMRRQEFRQKLEARARLRRESHGVSSLYPSHNGTSHNLPRNFTRAHAHVQTENYYEPLERPPDSEAGVQTDPWSEEGFVAPVVAPTVPGVDATTQVYDTEIDANSDDEALVAALVTRTMREAALEVAREEKAEDERINVLVTAELSSFLKPEESSTDQEEDKTESEEKSAAEEREEPEGKETTPEGTVEIPVSLDIRSMTPGGVSDVTEVMKGQEQETVVN